MTIFKEVGDLRKKRAECPLPIALVPTMGALHEGHRALIRRARQAVGPEGTVAVSIFVNPIQFDRAQDLESYPRPLEDDLALCRAEGVDLIFTPEKASLYQPDHSILVTESRLSKHLCGATRPGHFDGVLTIVLKLFNLFQPAFAVFGEKDFQQLALIRRLIRDLDLPVDLIGLPTVRENDGLALSSRNRKLTPSQRSDAKRIVRALRAARDLGVTGESNPAVYLDCARTHLLKEAPSCFSIDYLEIVDPENLEPVARMSGRVILATACWYDEVRLIDHISL